MHSAILLFRYKFLLTNGEISEELLRNYAEDTTNGTAHFNADAFYLWPILIMAAISMAFAITW